MKYFRRVEGPNVYLSPMNPEDYERYTKWLNDPELVTLVGNDQLISLQGEKAYLEKMAGELGNFAIVRSDDNQLLGNASLMGIDHRHSHATCGIFIGERENLEHGYGSEAMALLVSYGFDELNLHNIRLHAFSYNQRAIRAYEKVGFRRVGALRQVHFVRGAFHDEVIMDILPGELNRALIEK